jgi:spore coat polysaccharide biosynthesis protein SpsF
MPIRILVEAEMNADRQRVSPLADVAGRPLLVRCCERLTETRRQAGPAWQLFVVTTTAAEDDAIEQAATAAGFRCVRGTAHNLLDRCVQATADLSANDIVVRANFRHPLYCPELTQRLVGEHMKLGGDYRGVNPPSTLVPEVVGVRALRTLAQTLDRMDRRRDDYTAYFREGKTAFRARTLPPTWSGLDPNFQPVVESPHDLARIDALYRTLISLHGIDRPGEWTIEQIEGVADGLTGTPTARKSAEPIVAA